MPACEVIDSATNSARVAIPPQLTRILQAYPTLRYVLLAELLFYMHVFVGGTTHVCRLERIVINFLTINHAPRQPRIINTLNGDECSRCSLCCGVFRFLSECSQPDASTRKTTR